ncbi:translocation/assembly module TamB domain-containing protein [Reichenbachiella ulvae]|uniref:Translocation/assembly module TamB n=1 Tax=Reichenbachiella ulvae TaxID=2980104 RepID=A0ABT3CSU9_9BACT|nr:translocation/assembly module TamB [Reichenbachiella ulvae]MCV9386781.1 translocation/assembly module TamB [Reichenbachiella ulvae]
MTKQFRVDNRIIFHRVKRVFVWIPILLLAFLFLGFAFFQIPRVQTRTINSFLQQISDQTSYAITIGHANLTSFDKMLIEDLRIYEKSTDSTFISAKRTRVDISLFDLIFKKELNADVLELEAPYVHLIKKNDSTEINATVFINELKGLIKNPNEEKKKLKIAVDRVEIDNGKFSFNDWRKDSIRDGKDYYHFQYSNLLATVSNFTFDTDSIGMEVDRMRSKDPSGHLPIQSFFGKISFTFEQLAIYDFLLKTNKSQLGDSLFFHYSQPSNFSYFVDSISFDAQFKRSVIDFSEISLFSPDLDANDRISLTGEVSGKVKKLNGKNLDVRIGSRSRLRGKASLYGLPNIKETFIDLELKNSVLLPKDVAKYVPPEQMDRVNKIGITQFDGSFLGFPTDFVATGEFYSEAGKVVTDLNFKINEKSLPAYTGQLEFQEFNLKALMPDSKNLGNITMKGSIKGYGFEKSDAHFNLNAFMDSIEFSGYNYKNIATEGYFEEEIFKGKLSIVDPNLAFSGDLDIDLREDINKIDVSARLDSAHLHHLGLMNEPLTISSRLDIDIKGLKTDDIKGYVNLYDNQILYRGSELEIDSIKLLSSEFGNERILHIETEGLTGQIKGQYQNSALFSSMAAFGQELWMYTNPDSIEVAKYYREKRKKKISPFQAEVTINLWNLNKFVQPFFPTFNLSPNVKLEGEYKQDSTTQLSLFSTFDSLEFENLTLTKNELDFNISKKTMDKEVLAAMFVSSQSQKISEKYSSEALIFDAIWYQENMEVYLNLEQPEYNNHFEIYTDVKFLPDEIQFSLAPSDIKILDQKWSWREENLVTIRDQGLTFSNLKLQNDEEFINIDGSYDFNPLTKLKITVNEFDFKNLQSLFETKIEGMLDGDITIQRKEIDDLIESDLIARSVVVEDFLLGNIFAISHWENSKNRLAVNLDLVRNQNKKIDISGYIYPYSSNNQLDLEARLEEAELKILEPIFKSSIDNLVGTADAELEIKGKLSRPEIYGKAMVKNGATTINYLKTRYQLDGEIIFNDTQIIPNRMELRDIDGDLAYLSGSITHDGFDDLQLDIHADFNRFQLLNTSKTDNNAYYGSAYGTGEIHFGGTIDNLIIIANARTEKGTHLAIPIGSLDQYDVDQQEYIEFVDMTKDEETQTLQETIEKNVSKIKGVQLMFDIEMTTDAYVEMIFDIKAGDIIRGRGNGNIKLQINTDGDFNMFGDYQIDNGGYNFTLYNIINKEFDIQKGSSISWYGNPYEAQLNITANYRQITSMEPIIKDFFNDPEVSDNAEARRKYPSIVKLSLTGDLLSPKIKFGIDIKDYPQNAIINGTSLDAIINAFMVKLASNEQEMNRQVFSLLILRKFSPENSFEVNSQSIGSSLSEFVSNQLSYWATQVDENLEIDVDLAGLSDDAYNTFQLRLSYTFLDGRLRVTRGGGLPNENQGNEMTSIIGDWTVEYLLTKDGRLRAKMYSRSDLNDIASASGQSGIETGFSLQYVRSFDEFSQILSDSRDKNRKKRQEEQDKKSEAIREEEEEIL